MSASVSDVCGSSTTIGGGSDNANSSGSGSAGVNGGDWICGDVTCHHSNFARRKQCNKCHRDRSVERSSSVGSSGSNKKKLGSEIGKAAAEKSRGLFSAEDWQCNKCANVNWARRNTCNMCNAPKFTDVEERTGFGGGYNDRGVVEYKEREESDSEYDEFGRLKKKRMNSYNQDDGPQKIKTIKDKVIDEDEEDEEEDGDDDDLAKYNLFSDDEEEAMPTKTLNSRNKDNLRDTLKSSNKKDKSSTDRRSRSKTRSDVRRRQSYSSSSGSSSSSSSSTSSSSSSSSKTSSSSDSRSRDHISAPKRTYSRSRSRSRQTSQTKKRRSSRDNKKPHDVLKPSAPTKDKRPGFSSKSRSKSRSSNHSSRSPSFKRNRSRNSSSSRKLSQSPRSHRKRSSRSRSLTPKRRR